MLERRPSRISAKSRRTKRTLSSHRLSSGCPRPMSPHLEKCARPGFDSLRRGASVPGDLTSDQKEVLLRWRLCLGRRADGVGALGVSLGGLGMNAASGPLSMPAWGLDGRALLDLDAAVEFIYGWEGRGASLGGADS